MKKDPSEKSVPKFTDVESHVFTEHGGKVFIGKEQVTDQLRSVLRDEAAYIENSRLWEILNASITNEAYNLALIQSKDFDAVAFAKALHHWAHFIRNVVHTLGKTSV